MSQTFSKDPDAVLDYKIDWSDWLVSDTIVTSEWSVSGVTKNSDSNTTTTATIVVSGGSVGTNGTAKNTITTTDGLTDQRTIKFSIYQK